MKNINIYAVALVMALASCTNKEEIEAPQQESNQTIKAEIVQNVNESRIGIGELSEGKYPLTWTGSDFLSVIDSEGTRASYMYKGAPGAQAGRFEKDEYYKDVNPKNVAYAIANIDAEAIWVEPGDASLKPTFDFNSGGTASRYSINGGNIPMYGAWNAEKEAVQFYPVMGFLKVNIKAINGETLVFACDDEHCIGDSEATIQMEAGKPETAKIAVSKWGNSDREIGIGGTFLIPLPAQQYKHFTMYVKREVTVGNGYTELKSKTITIKPKATGSSINIEKKIYDLGDLDFGTLDNLKPTEGEVLEWDRVDEWTDVDIIKPNK